MLQALFNLFFPELCPGCGKPMPVNQKTICLVCRHEMPFTSHQHLPENEAFQKFYGRIPMESVQCLLYYPSKGIVRNCIHRLKYSGRQEIGSLFASWFCSDEIRISMLQTVDYIVPVPLHPKKLKKRGYNQVTTFAEGLSEKLNVPIAESLLRRNFDTKTQTRKNRLLRSQLKAELFTCADQAPYHQSHFLLIDDVLTTGATLEACAKALMTLPGARISVVCMAYSQS